MRWRSGGSQAPLGVAQNGFNLFTSYAEEPFEEIVRSRSIFEISKRLHRHLRASENPGPPELSGDSLNDRTLAPIKRLSNERIESFHAGLSEIAGVASHDC